MLIHQRPSPIKSGISEIRCDNRSERYIKLDFPFYIFLKSYFYLLFFCTFFSDPDFLRNIPEARNTRKCSNIY